MATRVAFSVRSASLKVCTGARRRRAAFLSHDDTAPPRARSKPSAEKKTRFISASPSRISLAVSLQEEIIVSPPRALRVVKSCAHDRLVHHPGLHVAL